MNPYLTILLIATATGWAAVASLAWYIGVLLREAREERERARYWLAECQRRNRSVSAYRGHFRRTGREAPSI